MKRFFFTVIALAAVAVSCTKSGLLETPQTYEDPISFEPYTGKVPTTKATEIIDVDNGFHVVGFETDANGVISTTANQPYMEGNVKKTNGVWGYETPAYWPESPLSFVAYGLNNDSSGTSGFGNNLTLSTDKKSVTYSVNPNPATQQDLVISNYIVNPNRGDEITVQLYHVLSKVGFKLIATGTANTNVAIKNVTLNGTFASQATFDLTKLTAPDLVSGAYTSTTGAFSTSGTPTTSYSLFNSSYTYKGTGEDLPYFITTTTTADGTPIYPNSTFDAANYTPEAVSVVPGANEAAAANRFLMILPGQIGNTSTDGKPYIEVLYQLPGIEEQKATMWLTTDGTEAGENWTFIAGKGYEFVLTLSTTAVSFGVTVDEWDTDLNENEQADDDIPLN